MIIYYYLFLDRQKFHLRFATQIPILRKNATAFRILIANFLSSQEAFMIQAFL